MPILFFYMDRLYFSISIQNPNQSIRSSNRDSWFHRERERGFLKSSPGKPRVFGEIYIYTPAGFTKPESFSTIADH